MQKKTLQITLTALFLAFALMFMSTSTVVAGSSETVDTDEPVYPYWKVGGTVIISGTGYNETHAYNVTVIYPGAVVTAPVREFTGLTAFTADYVISDVDPEGTYKVEVYDINFNALVASCHFGIWGTDETSYQRAETITVAGGGTKASSTVTVNFYNTTDDLIATKTTVADAGGEWSTSWTIPRDADLGIWTVEIDGSEFDPPYNAFLSETTFEVTAATLSVTIDAQPESSFERTETASMTFWIQYPDNSYYAASDLGSITVGVYRMVDDVQTLVYEFGLVAGDFDSGTNTWNASWNIPVCADLDVDYHFKILEDGIEDKVSPDPNKGPAENVVSDYFEVVSANLSVVVTSDEDEYGGLSTVYFTAEINYPNGTDFTTDYGGEAYANIWIDADDDNEVDDGEFTVVEDLPLTYDSGNEWDGEYDLYLPGAINGTYKIKVYAVDDCDNSGEGEDLFDVVPETKKDDNIDDPIRGPVGGEVDIWGSGFAPDTGVFVGWYMSITGDFVGVGDGETTEFPLTMMELVVYGSETIYFNGIETSAYSMDPNTGVITFDTAPASGVVITADYDVMIMLAMTTTNEYGSFATTFTVPESYACEHEVWAIQMLEPEPLYAIDIYCVEPQIVLSSTKGPPEAWITVTGTGFAPNEEVDIWVEYWYEDWYYIEEWSWVIAVTDAYGTFSQAILLPTLSLQAMYWDFGIAYGVYMICAEDYSIDGNYAEDYYLAVLFCEPSVIDVEVETGALYFPGEVFTVYALTSVDGVPMDVHDIQFLLYYETLGPIPLYQFLPVVHVNTGLYAVTTTLPPDIGPGNYLIVVTATKSCWIGFYVEVYGELEWEATINGVGMDGFIISPTLMGMNAMLIGIEGDIATINTNIGQIQLSLSSIDATLSSIQGSIATIETNIGTIQTDISTINGAISSIQGNIVTIQTDIGTIKTDISSINGHIATIEADIVTIETDIGTIKTDISAIDGRLTSIEGGVAIIQTAIGDIEVKLDETVIPFLEAIEAKLDFINATTVRIETVIGDIEVKLEDIGEFLEDMKAEIIDIEEKIDGAYLALNTTLGEIKVKLEYLDATLVAIHGDTAEILVRIGTPTSTIFTELSSIKARITEVEEDVATIETDIGTIQVDLTDINTKITVTNDNIALIETDIGTIKGRLTSIEGNVATIETDIGTIQTETDKIESIKTDTSLQPATVALSLIAAIAAIAAAVMVLRKVYVK